MIGMRSMRGMGRGMSGMFVLRLESDLFILRHGRQVCSVIDLHSMIVMHLVLRGESVIEVFARLIRFCAVWR